MSNPVEGATQAPLFGGTSGVRRDAPGAPTSVPGALPAFRGRENTPGLDIAVPTIRSSYNRQNRGTNQTVVYARTVDVEEPQSYGRVAEGDVVFHTTFRRCPTVTVSKAAAGQELADLKAKFEKVASADDGNEAKETAREKLRQATAAMDKLEYDDRAPTKMKLAGIDFLNRALGGRPEYDDEAYSAGWTPGVNVIVGSPLTALEIDIIDSPFDALTKVSEGEIDPVADNVADEWRSLHLLEQWACDGVVVSNDTPGCYGTSTGVDGQLFNIAVQGVATVMNGYCDYKGNGLHRNSGAHGEERVFGDVARSTYDTFPMQMFDRNVTVGDDLYVGLVCTRRLLDSSTADTLNEATERFYGGYYDANLYPTAPERIIYTEGPLGERYFYTFHYAPFSSRQLHFHGSSELEIERGIVAMQGEATYSEQMAKKDDAQSAARVEHKRLHGKQSVWEHGASHRHFEDAPVGSTFDFYYGVSLREIEGMVGAWRIGRVIDSSARTNALSGNGSVRTSKAVSANVNVSFEGWRALRRTFARGDVGCRIPGAAPWMTADATSALFATPVAGTDGTDAVRRLLAMRATVDRADASTLTMPPRARESEKATEKATAEWKERDLKYRAYLQAHGVAKRTDKSLGEEDMLTSVNGIPDVIDLKNYSQNHIVELFEVKKRRAEQFDDGRSFSWPTEYWRLTTTEQKDKSTFARIKWERNAPKNTAEPSIVNGLMNLSMNSLSDLTSKRRVEFDKAMTEAYAALYKGIGLSYEPVSDDAEASEEAFNLYLKRLARSKRVQVNEHGSTKRARILSALSTQRKQDRGIAEPRKRFSILSADATEFAKAVKERVSRDGFANALQRAVSGTTLLQGNAYDSDALAFAYILSRGKNSVSNSLEKSVDGVITLAAWTRFITSDTFPTNLRKVLLQTNDEAKPYEILDLPPGVEKHNFKPGFVIQPLDKTADVGQIIARRALQIGLIMCALSGSDFTFTYNDFLLFYFPDTPTTFNGKPLRIQFNSARPSSGDLSMPRNFRFNNEHVLVQHSPLNLAHSASVEAGLDLVVDGADEDMVYDGNPLAADAAMGDAEEPTSNADAERRRFVEADPTPAPAPVPAPARAPASVAAAALLQPVPNASKTSAAPAAPEALAAREALEAPASSTAIRDRMFQSIFGDSTSPAAAPSSVGTAAAAAAPPPSAPANNAAKKSKTVRRSSDR